MQPRPRALHGGGVLAAALLCAALCASIPSHVEAQIPTGDATAATMPSLDDTTDRGLTESLSRWRASPQRLFVGGMVDAGYLYVKPSFIAGYGRPHWSYAGLVVSPTLTLHRLGAYGGLRLNIPYFSVNVGARYIYDFRQRFLTPQNQYTLEDVEIQRGDTASYFTAEADIAGSLPLGPGDITLLLSGYMVFGVPEGQHVFLDTVRMVVEPPFLLRGRIGYPIRFGNNPPVSWGPVIEVLYNPGREAAVVRGGVVLAVRLFDDLEILAALLPVIASPDSLGLEGADFAQLGLRWLWATGASTGTQPIHPGEVRVNQSPPL